jgi:hypothetical protein
VTADTAYQMWGLAQPCAPKDGPTKWLQDDCHKASVLNLEDIKAVIWSLEHGCDSDYTAYWLAFYRNELERRQ